MRQDCIHFYDKIYETGLHSFFWQDGMRQDCIHFSDKIVWGRTAYILNDKLAKDRYSSIFLWQAIIIPVLIRFDDKPA